MGLIIKATIPRVPAFSPWLLVPFNLCKAYVHQPWDLFQVWMLRVAVYMRFSLLSACTCLEDNPQKPLLESLTTCPNFSDKSDSEDKIFVSGAKKQTRCAKTTFRLKFCLLSWEYEPHSRFMKSFSPENPDPLSTRSLPLWSNERQKPWQFCILPSSTRNLRPANSRASKSFSKKTLPKCNTKWRSSSSESCATAKVPRTKKLMMKLSKLESFIGKAQSNHQVLKWHTHVMFFCSYVTQHDMSVWWRVGWEVKADDKIRMIHCWFNEDHLPFRISVTVQGEKHKTQLLNLSPQSLVRINIYCLIHLTFPI